MKTKIEKKLYMCPAIECIKLDNIISLVLMSQDSDPGDPNQTSSSITPDYFNNNPFKTNLG